MHLKWILYSLQPLQWKVFALKFTIPDWMWFLGKFNHNFCSNDKTPITYLLRFWNYIRLLYPENRLFNVNNNDSNVCGFWSTVQYTLQKNFPKIFSFSMRRKIFNYCSRLFVDSVVNVQDVCLVSGNLKENYQEKRFYHYPMQLYPVR